MLAPRTGRPEGTFSCQRVRIFKIRMAACSMCAGQVNTSFIDMRLLNIPFSSVVQEAPFYFRRAASCWAPPAAFSDVEPEKKRIKVQYLSAIAKNSQRQALKVRNCTSQAFQNHSTCPEEVFIIGWHEAHGHPKVHSCMHAFAGQS